MSANSVDDEGGALYLDGAETSDGDPAEILNSTIVGNDADSPDEGGGGIFREDFVRRGALSRPRRGALVDDRRQQHGTGEPRSQRRGADQRRLRVRARLQPDRGPGRRRRPPRTPPAPTSPAPIPSSARWPHNGGPTADPPAGALEPGARRRDRQRPHIRPARPATHLRRGRDRQQRRLRRHRHRFDRAATGRERPARQRLLPGRGGRLEDRHRGPRHAHRHRRPRRAVRRRRRRRPHRPRRQRLLSTATPATTPPTAAAARTWSRARPARTSSRAPAARTSSREPAARTRQTAAAARTRSPAAPARTRSRAVRARTSSRATAAPTSSRPPTASATRSTAAAATRTRPPSTPRTRSRPTARR